MTILEYWASVQAVRGWESRTSRPVADGVAGRERALTGRRRANKIAGRGTGRTVAPRDTSAERKAA